MKHLNRLMKFYERAEITVAMLHDRKENKCCIRHTLYEKTIARRLVFLL